MILRKLGSLLGFLVSQKVEDSFIKVLKGEKGSGQVRCNLESFPVGGNGEEKEDKNAMPFEASQTGGQSHGRKKEALEKQQGSQVSEETYLASGPASERKRQAKCHPYLRKVYSTNKPHDNLVVAYRLFWVAGTLGRRSMASY